MANVEDKYTNLGRSGDDEQGEPVDYDPFPEDAIKLSMKAIEKLARNCVSNTERLSAALNKQAAALNELARSIKAKREVVRDENGKISGIKFVH
jgi:1-acyl-sn-glycerol-3-phosphate acyltransferase